MKIPFGILLLFIVFVSGCQVTAENSKVIPSPKVILATPTITPIPPNSTPKPTWTTAPIDISNPATYPYPLNQAYDSGMRILMIDLQNNVVYDEVPQYQLDLDKTIKQIRRLWLAQQGVEVNDLSDAQILDRSWLVLRAKNATKLTDILMPLSPVEIRAAEEDPNYAISRMTQNGKPPVQGLRWDSNPPEKYTDDFIRQHLLDYSDRYVQLAVWINVPRPLDFRCYMTVEGVAPLYGISPDLGVIVALSAIRPDGSKYYIYRTSFFQDFTPEYSSLIYDPLSNTNIPFEYGSLTIYPTSGTFVRDVLTPDMLLQKVLTNRVSVVSSYGEGLKNGVEHHFTLLIYGIQTIENFTD